jgi:hypothetical protein
VEAQVEALLATIDADFPVNFQPCDVSKEIQSLKLEKACGFMACQMNVSGIFEDDLLYI